MKNPKGLIFLLYITLFSLPFSIFVISKSERDSFENLEKWQAMENKANAVLENIQKSGSTFDQYQILIDEFAKRASKLKNKSNNSLNRLHNTMLEKNLPRHDVAIAFTDASPDTGTSTYNTKKRFTTFLKDSGLDFAKTIGKKFLFSVLNNGEIEYNREMALQKRFSKILSFPMQVREIIDNKEAKSAKIFIFNSFSGMRGIYWNKTDSYLIAVFIHFGNKYPNPNHGMKMLASNWNKSHENSDIKIGFISSDNKKILFSGDVKEHKGNIKSIIKQTNAQQNYIKNNFRDQTFISISTPVSFGVPWKAFVIFKRNNAFTVYSLREKIAWLLSFSFLAFGFAFALQRLTMNRGIKFSVPGVLLTSCFSLVLLPVGGIAAFSQRGVEEIGKNDQERLKEALKSDLERMESLHNYLTADLIQKFVLTTKQTKLLRKIINSKSDEEMKNSMDDIASFSNNITRSIYEKAIEALYAITSNKNTGVHLRKRMGVKDANDSIKPIAETFKQLFIRINSRVINDPSSKFLPEKENITKDTENEMKTDILADVLDMALGREMLISLLTLQKSISSLKVSHIDVYFLLLSFIEAGKVDPSYIFWYWTNWVDHGFMRWCIKYPYSPEYSEKDRFNSFPKGWRAILHGEHSSNIFRSDDGLVYPDELLKAMKSIQNTNIPRSGQDLNSPGKPFYEAYIGNNLKLFILGAFRSSEWLDERKAFFNNAITLISVLSFLVAISLAKKGTEYFLQPLLKLRNALKSVEGGNYKEKLDTNRRDEFGEIASVFNSMTKSLEEGKILGTYVSESVLKAVEDSSFNEKPKKAEHREVTILFSGIFDFDELRKTKPPEVIHAILNAHLCSFNRVLADIKCGYIDKVMGDKILAIFDHEKNGGADQAMENALETVNRVQDEMKQNNIFLAMGINSGIVVAGILGAQSVRLTHTVIGDTVNLASRLSTLAHITGGTRVVLSGQSLTCLKREIPVEKLPFKKVKGKTQQVEAWLLKDSR
ncbi:MAG: adenylate/guanylate cyclase domain-containing protein [Candidatus Riflebacteria bacterium]|nr:adenylate/guanylate cyclase domain-containing protein [Candidatus Riflebacteria bacterium]